MKWRVLVAVFGVSGLLIAASVTVLLLISGVNGGNAQATDIRQAPATQQQDASDDQRQDARLDVDALHLIPDDEIEMVLMEFVWYRIGGDYKREYEVVTGLSPGLQMLYTTWTVEAEVNNGGFHQYFANTEGRLAPEALEGFELLGANKHAQIMANAIAIYAKERPNLENLKPFASSLDSHKYTDFDSLDTEFYSIGPEENLRQMRLKYIRQHPDQFTGSGFLQ